MSQSVEQDARDLLERLGVEDAQSWTAGDLVELANILRELYHLRQQKTLRQRYGRDDHDSSF